MKYCTVIKAYETRVLHFYIYRYVDKQFIIFETETEIYHTMPLNHLEMVEWTHPFILHQHKCTLFTNSSVGEKGKYILSLCLSYFSQHLLVKKERKITQLTNVCKFK